MTMWPWLVSVLAGVLHGFSMAWPAVLGGDALQISGQASGFLQCLSLAMLAALLLRLAASDGPQKRLWLKAFWLSGLFATSAMVATWGWLYVSMHRYGGLPAWLSAAAVLLLAMALSVYFAVAGGLWVALFRRWILSDRDNEARYAKQAAGLTWDVLRQGLAGVALFAALWTMAELSRGQLFTGFPWGASGYAHTDSWLATYLWPRCCGRRHWHGCACHGGHAHGAANSGLAMVGTGHVRHVGVFAMGATNIRQLIF